MLWVDGLRLGSRTRFALDQSTNSALSRASQNLRSCASDLNRGSLVFAVINLPFLSRVSRVTTVSGSVVPAIVDRLYMSSSTTRSHTLCRRLPRDTTLVIPAKGY